MIGNSFFHLVITIKYNYNLNDMNYFVTVYNVEIASNLTRQQAIDIANEKYKEIKSTICIKIGKIKYMKGEIVYSCLPMHFYI